MRQEMTEELKHKREHHSCHGDAENRIDERIEAHLLQ